MRLKRMALTAAIPVMAVMSLSVSAETETERKIAERQAAQVAEMKAECPECYRASAFITKMRAFECLEDQTDEILLDVPRSSSVYMKLMMSEIKYGNDYIVESIYAKASELVDCDEDVWFDNIESWWNQDKDRIISMAREGVKGSYSIEDIGNETKGDVGQQANGMPPNAVEPM